MLKSLKRIHFVGIGGIGMSALARILITQGYAVTGSDIQASTVTDTLKKLGCRITIGADAVLPDTDAVVASSAIPPDIRELSTARERNIPVFHRSEILASLMAGAPSIGVSGTHGKTTTSALISFLIEELGLHPTCLVGGIMTNYETNALIGDGKIVVAEVDESDKSLLNIHPTFAVITNLEEEHLDSYKNLDDIKATFEQYFNGLSTEGVVIYNYDDQPSCDIVTRSGKKNISFGLKRGAFFRARNIIYDADTTAFDLYINERFVTVVISSLRGEHNVYNTLAALAALHAYGIDVQEVLPILPSFKGTGRRLEIKYQDDTLTIIDDYAHHPTEIVATINVLQRMKKPEQMLIVVFQPHRFSRTLHFGEQFGSCFHGADLIMVTEIYGAGERPIDTVDETVIVNAMRNNNAPPVERVHTNTLVTSLLQRGFKKALIAFLGAGSITKVADEFSTSIKNYAVRE